MNDFRILLHKKSPHQVFDEASVIPYHGQGQEKTSTKCEYKWLIQNIDILDIF